MLSRQDGRMDLMRLTQLRNSEYEKAEEES
jgi:hypothetical protein